MPRTLQAQERRERTIDEIKVEAVTAPKSDSIR
jgi:hypothetical protein